MEYFHTEIIAKGFAEALENPTRGEFEIVLANFTPS